jgi:hypothetical protein
MDAFRIATRRVASGVESAMSNLRLDLLEITAAGELINFFFLRNGRQLCNACKCATRATLAAVDRRITAFLYLKGPGTGAIETRGGEFEAREKGRRGERYTGGRETGSSSDRSSAAHVRIEGGFIDGIN